MFCILSESYRFLFLNRQYVEIRNVYIASVFMRNRNSNPIKFTFLLHCL